VIKVVVELFTR